MKPLVLVHVYGSVRDRDGVGMASVEVRAAAGRNVFYATTDASGEFTMELAEGKYEIAFRPRFDSGYGEIRLNEVPITKRSSNIDYRYMGLLVKGTLLDPEGAPLDSGTVLVGDDAGENYFYKRFVGGTFSVWVPRASSYRVVGYPPQPNMPRSGAVILVMSADTVITLQINGVPLTGVISGPSGSPLSGARITAANDDSYSHGVTDAAGAYRFWVSEGGYRFRISPPSDMAFILERFTPYYTITGPTTLDASLDGTHWRGYVRAVNDGSTIQSASVSALMIGDYYVRTAADTTAVDGAFELVVEPGKEYDLTINAPTLTRPLMVRGLIAGADSTFDVYVDVPTP